MAYRNGNYCAFYVSEPFNASALGANATRDFNYYNLLKAWKAQDASYPFNDSHAKTYNVRDDSNWETTLKPRLRERLQCSKNIVLILSSKTIESRAVKEEIEYGISNQGLPVIVIYPEYSEKSDLVADGKLRAQVKSMWDKLPTFKLLKGEVPVLHVPMNKFLIKKALEDSDLTLGGKIAPSNYWYSV
ncbi:TIR domain-containing protein [Pseudomonas sp.]|uniref:TIR domain-containing protein n=1 Tax=Pseudomonas sp. TaxID=306 RepID=UPI0026045167|nr:TIR domain-containing protein [Pseudomonas sp.]